MWNVERAELVEVREKMVRLLEAKMLAIGDEPAHPCGLPAEKLRAMYASSRGAAAAGKRQEHNMASHELS